MMKFLSAKQTAKKWSVSERRVLELLRGGRIEGTRKNGRYWLIPSEAKKPYDRRSKSARFEDGQKTYVVAGVNSEIGLALANILSSEGYEVIGLYQNGSQLDKRLSKVKDLRLVAVDYFDRQNLLDFCNSINQDLEGFVFMEIYFDLEDAVDFNYDKFENSYRVNVFAANLLVRELVKKMNYDSSIVMVNSIESTRGSFGASGYASAQAAKVNLVQTFANVFSEMYGVRINSVMPGWIGGLGYDAVFDQTRQTIPMKRLGEPYEIADDIFLMLTRHKYATGSSLVSDGGYLAVDEQSKTEDLSSGKFYRYLEKFISEAKPGSTLWATSMMMDNEWNEDALERKFRQDNLDAANRGVKVERVYIFNRKDADKFKDNPSIQVFSANKNMTNWFVDIDTLKQNYAELWRELGAGWVGIDEYVLLPDLPNDGVARGYVTFNKKEIHRAKACFDELKKYAVPLKDVLK